MEKKSEEQSSEENNSDKNDSVSSESEEAKKKKLLNKKRKQEKSKEKEEKEDKKEKKEKKEKKDIIVNDKDVIFLLDDRKRVTVHKFKGQLKVDIREFYDDKGEMKPGKKGISLSLEHWKKLKNFIDDIDESIDNMK